MADTNTGKMVCNELKKARIELAKANNIPFETVECTYNGPCNGTCPKCDEENMYLKKELEKIDNPVYPDMDVMKKRNVFDDLLGGKVYMPGLMGAVAFPPTSMVGIMIDKMYHWLGKK